MASEQNVSDEESVTKRISCITLNVRGLHDNCKRNKVFRWLNDQKGDVIFLQETYCTEKLVPYFNSSWKGKVYHSLSDSVHSRGVCIMFSNKMRIKLVSKHCSQDGRILLLNAELNDIPTSLMCVYAPNTEKSRKEFYSKMKKMDKSVCII